MTGTKPHTHVTMATVKNTHKCIICGAIVPAPKFAWGA